MDEIKERISFEVDAKFKALVDLEIARRRSTLKREGTLAFADWLGIAPPGAAADEKNEAGKS